MSTKKFDVQQCKIISKKEIAKDTFDFVVHSPYFAKTALPGQFAHIRVPSKTLRRPISICDIDKDNETMRLIFQIRGEGTRELSLFDEGDVLDILAPLGDGTFTMFESEKKALFIGGGIGVPPLLYAAKNYGKNAVVIIGFRDKDSVILEDDFKNLGCEVIVTTDDGSYSHHGLVTDVIPDKKYDAVYSCGPTPMLKAVKSFAEKTDTFCEISLEERMACGIGACLVCACKLKKESDDEYFGHVCKDGPVFNSKKVVF